MRAPALDFPRPLSPPTKANDRTLGSLYETILCAGEVRSYDLAPDTATEVFLLAGQAWITLEGDPTDHVLKSGDRLRFTGAGKLVIESLDSCTELVLLPV